MRQLARARAFVARDRALRSARTSVGHYLVSKWEIPLLGFVLEWSGNAKSGKSHFWVLPLAAPEWVSPALRSPPLVFAISKRNMGISAKRYARAAELSECARPKLCRAAAKGKACCLSLDSEKAHLHGAEAICDCLPALQRRGVALFDKGEVATMMMARPR